MQELYRSLATLILVLIWGAVMQKRLNLPESFYGTASTLVIRVTLPAMIIASMDKDFSYDTAVTSLHMLLIAIVLFGLLIAGLEIWRRFSRLEKRTLNLYQFLILVGNTAFMGYPVLRALYGDDGVFFASVFNLIHNIVTFSYAVSLFRRGQKIQWRKLLQNAYFLATLIGGALFLSPLGLPSEAHQALEWVGNITIPLCLLTVGARLVQQPLRELVRPAALWGVSLTRLILFPLLILPIMKLFGFSGIELAIPVILFATPVALTSADFAAQYGADEKFAGKAVALSNLVATITISVVAIVLVQ